MGWQYLLILLSFTILFVPDAFADESHSFNFQPGTIKFDTNLEDLSCNDVSPVPEIGTATSFNIDDMDDHFFIFLSKTNSNTHHYLQIEIPDDKGKEERDSYLINFLKDSEPKSRQLYQGYGQMAIYMVTDSEEKEVTSDKHKQFLTGVSLKISPHRLTYAPGEYDFHSILFQSDKTMFVDDEVCAVSLHWQVSIDSSGNITVKEPNYAVGRVYLSEETESDLDGDPESTDVITLEEKISIEPKIEDTAHPNNYSMGTIEWSESTFSIGDYGLLKITDPDMNSDPDRVDIFTARAWSETDPDGINLDMVESGIGTSEFFIDVEFTLGDSGIQMLKTDKGDVVTASYLDWTTPDGKEMKIIDTVTIISDPVPPHKQIQFGILPENIKCQDNMELIFKNSDISPACVTSETKDKLLERGWSTP